LHGYKPAGAGELAVYDIFWRLMSPKNIANSLFLPQKRKKKAKLAVVNKKSTAVCQGSIFFWR
jgi:hypothetical protein